MTLAIVSERELKGRASTIRRQAIARTADRIHVSGGDGREWFFERNPVDPRRVSAWVVEHPAKSIVEYEESDLRMTLGIRGWADVLLLGFDQDALASLERRSDVRTIEGVRFVRYAAKTGANGDNDVWWSSEHGLTSQFTMRDASGVNRFRIERLSKTVDPDLLRPPAVRFPSYRTLTLADWLERH